MIFAGILVFLYAILYCYIKYDECDLKESKKKSIVESEWWKKYNEERFAASPRQPGRYKYRDWK